MKKNIMMRVAGGVLVATLLSTSIISGTFAKYVTRGEVADQARVAKFGVVITGSGDLFDTTYYRADLGNTPGSSENAGDATLTIESSNTENVVAPGAKNNDGLNLAITGAPEVDVKITLAVEAFTDIFLKANTYGNNYPDMTTSNTNDTFTFYNDNGEADYHPVLFTLKTGDGNVVPGCDGVTLEDLQVALETYEVYVDANTDLSAAVYSYTLSWEWAFEGPYSYTATNGDSITMNQKKVDQADTLLGDLMATRMGEPQVAELAEIDPANYSLDISVALSLTVTQVD